MMVADVRPPPPPEFLPMSISQALNPSDTLAAAPASAAAASRAAPAERTAAAVFAQPLAPLLTAGGVALLILVAILFARSSGMVVALWAAGPLAVAVWLRSGRGLGFDISFGGLMTVGVLAGQFLGGNTPAQSAMFTLANMVEIVLAVALTRRFLPSLNLGGVVRASRFVAVAAVAPLPAALIIGGALAAMQGQGFLAAAQTWWFGHTLGLVVVAPMLMAIDRRTPRLLLDPLKLAEWIGLIGLLGGAAYFAYFVAPIPVAFIAAPVLVVIAVRLRIPGVSAAMTVLSVCAIGAVLARVSPNPMPAPERIMLLQLTMLFATVPYLLMAALLNERDVLIGRAEDGRRRAEQASEAKSRLLANVAHEIKSPVSGVIGIGELWSSGQLGPVTPTQREMADMLVKTARQVETLSHDLLDVARAEAGAVKVELKPTDVVELIENIRRSVALRGDAAGLKTEAVYDANGLTALADPQRLGQVIDNLAVNAVKYAAGGGVVIFRAIHIAAGVRIEVSDKGPGLTPEKQAQLFEPFNRLGLERSAVEGHGIGLALAKRLIELQGGTIGVESTPGEGATFWIELPAA